MDQYTIKVTKNGYENLKKQIAEKEAELSSIISKRKEAFETGIGDGRSSPSVQHHDSIINSIRRELKELKQKLNNCIIIEQQKIENSVVNIGDVVVVEIKFAKDDIETSKIRIVADGIGFASIGGIDNISVDSPLGAAIFEKEVGKEYTYNAYGNEITVRVVSKENSNEQSVEEQTQPQ